MAVSGHLILPLLFTLLTFFLQAQTISTSKDATALLDFKTAVSHDPANILSNWNSSTNQCLWYGVYCEAGRVVALNFTADDSVLAGTLSPSIGNLTKLKSLSIRHKLFSGEIPADIGWLRNLEVLELQGNNFSGSIPDQIRKVISLRLVNLSYNSFTGSIPEGLIGGNRSVVDLSNNQLSGELRVAVDGKCEDLGHLKLSNNLLTDEIPAEIRNCVNLRRLLLDGNNFQGKIPPDIGRIPELRILDVSRNSLTGRIPPEIGECMKLSVVVLTNVISFGAFSNADGEFVNRGGELNAFEGDVPPEVLLLPSLEVFWAPRANLGGSLPSNWIDSPSCSLRVLNLGQNYVNGTIPEGLATMCKNLTFLDLSSNGLFGDLPSQLPVSCMMYFNVSRNSLSGVLPSFWNGGCGRVLGTSYYGERDPTNILIEETIHNAHNFVVAHDFSWNRFVGSLPTFLIGREFFLNGEVSYGLFLNNNKVNGSLPRELYSNCDNLHSFSVNLSANQISGGIYPELFVTCLKLTDFEAAGNQIGGSIPPEIGSLKMLQLLDLSRNAVSGPLPDQLGDLKGLKSILLGENNLTGSIPVTLANATSLEILLLHHNRLSGEIPSLFGNLSNLTKMDLSFNNLSGHIPHLQHHNTDCDWFRGNEFLDSCPDQNSKPPATLPAPVGVPKSRGRQSKLKSILIAVTTSASIILSVLVVVFIVFILGRRRKLSRVGSLRNSKVVVTFADTPVELNYETVFAATGNFSIHHLIGTGGFGSTYKAELAPGFLVAVKKLSIGRFTGGIRQFDAEIRTLGQIRHKNLVTLIGYHVGEAEEMFLIYNYLSGGNLETFIHKKYSKNVEWRIIHKIAIDIARALTFLHYSCVPRIVHRDIKPSNILLDEELNAYISDFGLARLLEVSETHATTDVAGTFGYVDPQYATTCRVSDKADVYSFGVVLLELMSGKKSLDPSFSEHGNGFNIVGWARLLSQEGRSSEVFPPEVWASNSNNENSLLGMLKLAMACTLESLSVRPTMKRVLEKLKQLQPQS